MLTYRRFLRKLRISDYSKGKIKEIGFFEWIHCSVAGRKDGRRGLPRAGEDGKWSSPFLDRCVHACDDHSSKLWGRLQLAERSAYIELANLLDSARQTEVLLRAAEAELPKAEERELVLNSGRKHGEELLTEEQVFARRAREREKHLIPLRDKVNRLRTTLDSKTEKLSKCRNSITENVRSVSAICERYRVHLRVKADVYWNAAMRRHPERAKMPLLPKIEADRKTETDFLARHETLMSQAESYLLTRTSGKTEVTD